VEKEPLSDQNDKPVFDEQTLARVLEAAYVLQEHNRERREREEREKARLLSPPDLPRPASPLPAPQADFPKSSAPKVEKGDYSLVLGQIVETQQRIQAQRLELNSAMSLILERATEIAQADGAGIAVVEGGKVRYPAGSGPMALPAGTEVPTDKALCTACLRVGQVLRCSDVNPEFLVDAEECARRGIQSLIAAPVYQAGNVVGALELYYGTTHAFSEPDVHTCQLMAGIVAEALGRTEELSWKKPIEAESTAIGKTTLRESTLRDSLQKLKPKVEVMAKSAAAAPTISSSQSAPPATSSVASAVCHKCGNRFVEDEQFCGECGLPRSSDCGPVTMQSKVAMLWQMHEAKKKSANLTATNSATAVPELNESADMFRPGNVDDGFADGDLPELFKFPGTAQEEREASRPELQPSEEWEDSDTAITLASSSHPEVEMETPIGAHSPAETETADWSSAASAKNFLERFSKTNRYATFSRFIRARRGDVYLAIAIILVSCVIHWGLWPGRAAEISASHRGPNADLPLYDRVLIKLGLAEAPPPPEYKGSPNMQVWVDLQTALYYCPGADLYGKTSKGKFISQQDAQLDQYEPASRRPCE
jgi:GAF domain-containing protein